MDDKTLPKKVFDEIYSKVPRLCIDLIVKTKGGIILTKRTINPYKGMWHLPGGNLLFGESIENAAERIAKRELSLNIVVEKLLGYIEFDRKNTQVRHDISIVFLAQIKSGEIKLNDEADEFKITNNFDGNFLPEQQLFLKKNFNFL